MAHVRTGKIARLPFKIREQLNERLLNNEKGNTILPWINRAMKLSGEAAVTPQNLSLWREGGFMDWMGQRDKLMRTRSLAEYCHQMAKEGGGTMDLPAAIAGGQLMEVLEEFDPASIKTLLVNKPENWIEILGTLAKLQKSKAESRKGDQNEIILKQHERKLALSERQFEVRTCELFLKWLEDKNARELAENKNLKPAVAVEQLRALMFGKA
jgi:hypothetical protein